MEEINVKYLAEPYDGFDFYLVFPTAPPECDPISFHLGPDEFDDLLKKMKLAKRNRTAELVLEAIAKHATATKDE